MHGRWAERGRLALWALVAASWLALVPFLWSAFATVPSAERLESSHMAEIPTLATLGRALALSGVEAVVVLALLWPWRRRFYLARLWLAALGVAVWFLASTPLSLTQLAWMHRRWLAGVAALLLVAAVGGTLVAAGRRVLGRPAA